MKMTPLRRRGRPSRAASARRPSAFALGVYAIVKRIPPGQVRSYAWVARRLGKPGASRAVGQALKRNPWPLLVPCHRVIRSDGRLGGYAWGAARKRRLLVAERKKQPQQAAEKL
ncbi:MAG: MGMT family protein [Candidatus Omnitrophica bacterium]|nr:MGMT family protein [Candidatus Omnitrophota bacterium]